MKRRALGVAVFASACGGQVVEASTLGASSSETGNGADDSPVSLTSNDTTAASMGTSGADTMAAATTTPLDASGDSSDEDPSVGESVGSASTTTATDDGMTSLGDSSTTDDCVPVDETCDAIDNDCDGLIDEGSPANAACGACTFLLSADGGSYFALCGGALTWDQARNGCAAFGEGVDLATIDNELDQLALAPLVVEDIWIGLHLVGEGDWDWVDGTNSIIDGVKQAYDGWAADQPQGGEMDCAEFDPSGAWADAECAQLQASMCRHPA